jgi:hypothetical protein
MTYETTRTALAARAARAANAARALASARSLVLLLSAAMLACSEPARPPASAQLPSANIRADAGTAPTSDTGSTGQAGQAGQVGSDASIPPVATSNAAGMDNAPMPRHVGGTAGSDGTVAAAGSGGSSGEAGAQAAASGSGGAGMQPDDPPKPKDLPTPDQTVMPAETADATALNKLADWAGLPVLTQAKYQQQSSHDRGPSTGQADALFPTFAWGNRDLSNFVCKSADAQLGVPQLVAYHFDQDSCPEAYVHGVVLAKYEGSGSLLRFWMTASALVNNGAFAGEMLRVYVDDEPRPLVQVPLERVRSGAAGEIFAPPFGAASPYFIASYYPVVFSKKLVIAIDRLSTDYYYQVDVALDGEPKQRVAPQRRLPERDRAIAQLTAASPVAAQASSLSIERLALAAAEHRTLPMTGPTTIEELRLRVAKNKLASLAGVRLSVRWDDAKQAAIDLPLLDLFAAGRSVVARSNLALASSTDSDDQLLSLRLPMPFRTSAQWTLLNAGNNQVDFQLEWFGERVVPGADFGYLNVQRDEVMLPTTQLEQTFAHASGRGRYVGLCTDLAGHQDNALTLTAAPLNFLEGDVRATVDGRLALDGTGTEDYPDNSFYFMDSPKATPFAQNWGLVSDISVRPPGQVSFCRWQILGNEVDFQTDFKGTFEISQHDTSLVELHRTMAFFYLQ